MRAATAAATELRPAAELLPTGVGVLEPAGEVGVREGTTPVPAGWLLEDGEPVPAGPELELGAAEVLRVEGAPEVTGTPVPEVPVADVWVWLPVAVPVALTEAEVDSWLELEAEALEEELEEPEPPLV